MLRTYAVCEHCEDAEILYQKVQDPDFNYESIVGEDSENKFDEIEGWTIKGTQNEQDPLVVEFEYYCPECSALDAVFDSGERDGALSSE